MFHAGRQLPQLQSLDVSLVKQPTGGYAAIPDISRLVSCCPSLQCLNLRGLQIEPNLLQGLSGLHTLQTLHLTAADPMQQTLDVVCQLARLKQLHVDLTEPSQEGLMLQLTQLRQLTALTCRRCWPRAFRGGVDLISEVSNGGRGLAPVQGFSLLKSRPIGHISKRLKYSTHPWALATPLQLCTPCTDNACFCETNFIACCSSCGAWVEPWSVCCCGCPAGSWRQARVAPAAAAAACPAKFGAQ
jgi:hypothetical protein